MLDKYFKHPVVWDYMIAAGIVSIVFKLVILGYLNVPTEDHLYSTVSDMSTVGLTMAGFILTLLTVLISFKSTNKVNADDIGEDDKVFDIFFASKLYFSTVEILKNAIKSLTIVSLSGYTLKLFLKSTNNNILYFFCIAGATIILLTVWRCILILTRIIKIQEYG